MRVRIHPTHFRSFLLLTSVTAIDLEAREPAPNRTSHPLSIIFSRSRMLRPLPPGRLDAAGGHHSDNHPRGFLSGLKKLFHL